MKVILLAMALSSLTAFSSDTEVISLGAYKGDGKMNTVIATESEDPILLDLNCEVHADLIQDQNKNLLVTFLNYSCNGTESWNEDLSDQRITVERVSDEVYKFTLDLSKEMIVWNYTKSPCHSFSPKVKRSLVPLKRVWTFTFTKSGDSWNLKREAISEKIVTRKQTVGRACQYTKYVKEASSSSFSATLTQ